MAADILLKLEGVKGESRTRPGHPGLAPLLASLRQGNGRYVLTSVAHGARSPGRQQALDELRRLGVVEHTAAGGFAAAVAAPGFIVVTAEGSAEGRPRPLPVLMVIADQRDFLMPHLLLPAVQKVRDAAERLDLPAASSIAIVHCH